VYVKDARAFLQATDRAYDLIWVDVFARHMVPFHLTTVEFFAELRAHLTPVGIVAVNLASLGEGGDLLRANAVVQTMKRSFPQVESYAVKGPWKSVQTRAENLIFFAGTPLERQEFAELVNKVGAFVQQDRLPHEALALLNTHRTKPWSSGVELTDDYAPFDLLMGSGVVEPQPDPMVVK